MGKLENFTGPSRTTMGGNLQWIYLAGIGSTMLNLLCDWVVVGVEPLSLCGPL